MNANIQFQIKRHIVRYSQAPLDKTVYKLKYLFFLDKILFLNEPIY